MRLVSELLYHLTEDSLLALGSRGWLFKGGRSYTEKDHMCARKGKVAQAEQAAE